MPYDYSKLIGRIVELFQTRKNFAKVMEMSVSALSNKLHGTSSFSQDEIFRIIKLLQISPDEVMAYFFTLKVQ